MAKKAARKKAPRKKTLQASVPAGVLSDAQRIASIMSQTMLSRRVDLAAPITLAAPSGYYDVVREIAVWYKTDTLFQALISRIWEYGNNRADWVIVPEGAEDKAAEWEQGFWNYWSQQINTDLQNVVDGLDTVNGWLLKKLALTQLGVLHWEWGWLEYKSKKVWCPRKVKVESSLAVRLLSAASEFGNEQIWLYKGGSGKATVPSGYVPQGSETTYSSKQLQDDPHWKQLRPSTSFAVKLDALPEEDRMTYKGQKYTLSPTIMPSPRWECLVEAMRLRRQLARGDLAVLDALINFIIMWRVGDNTLDGKGRLVNQPQPARADKDGNVIQKSTIEEVADLLTTTNLAKASELILPYFIDLQLIQPDVQALMNVEKYFHATQSVFEAFGIFAPSQRLTGSATERTTDTAGFEQFVFNIRVNHIGRVWEMLTRKVMAHPKNTGVGFRSKASYQWRSLNTQTDEFREIMAGAMTLGQVSVESFHRVLGLHPKAEMARINKENKDGTMDGVDKHVPIQYIQQSVDPSGETKTTGDAKTPSRGRPRKGATSQRKGNRK